MVKNCSLANFWWCCSGECVSLTAHMAAATLQFRLVRILPSGGEAHAGV